MTDSKKPKSSGLETSANASTPGQPIYAPTMRSSDEFVEAMMSSPLGVTLLVAVESNVDRDGGYSFSLNTTPDSVAAAVASVRTMSFGCLADLAVLTGMQYVGPWVNGAETAAAAYRAASARLPIAEAIAERFYNELHAPLDRATQQWWSVGDRWDETRIPLFQDFTTDTFGAYSGEFTTAGMWTSTDPPPEAAGQMVGAWELETGPVSRCWMPVLPEARVFEIHRPQDWAQLVAAHPRQARPHPGWELPGTNQHHSDLAPLLDVPEQRAARATVDSHLVPDWESVASEYDGIHLSWAGFITSEGCITDLDNGGVVMLRYWFSERTLWLADIFGQPSMAPDPHIDFSSNHYPPRPPPSKVDTDLVLRLLGRPK